MGHPHSGLIQAFLDGEAVGQEAEELRAHLERCTECQAVLHELEVASQHSAQALFLLDQEPDLVKARQRIFESQPISTAKGPGAWWAISLPRAASIALLLTGALVTALPGSPVRRWMAEGWQALTRVPSERPRLEEGPEIPGSPDPLLQEAPPLPETGAGIPALGNGVEIWIHDLSADAELRILWTDGEEAWVFAPEGTRFNRTDGRLEAFGPPGDVRVEIPRSFARVTVGLNESVLLRKSGEEVEILGPVQERTPSEIRFDALGRSNAGLGGGVSKP